MNSNNPGRGNASSSSSSSGSSSSASNSINKRPRLLSFQGPTSSSESVAVDRVPMAAGPSSSSLEEINMRPEMAPDLASWQEAQIAACIEDNTINMVLEQYLNFFEARNNQNVGEMLAEEQILPPAEVTPPNEMVLELELEEQEQQEQQLIEDQAIMAAISERGLQPVVMQDDDESNSGMASGGQMDVDQQQQQGMDLLETAVVAAIQEKGLTATSSNATTSQFSQMEGDDGS